VGMDEFVEEVGRTCEDDEMRGGEGPTAVRWVRTGVRWVGGGGGALREIEP
jgi:hypothetical protein